MSGGGGEFAKRYGPWALVAGASEGIGAAFAEAVARRGLNVVMVARREGPLAQAQERLTRAYGVSVRTASIDLAAPDVSAAVAAATDGLEIGLFVANAAVSLTADFLDLDVDMVERTMAVGVRAPVLLAHRYAKGMVERGRGGLIFMSSVAALIGSPYVSTYAGSKAFALNFSESLWAELQPKGVDVIAVAAGPTHTPTYDAVQPAIFPPVMRASDVAEAALGALGKSTRVVPGWFNKASSALVRRLPRTAALRMIASQTRRFGPRLR